MKLKNHRGGACGCERPNLNPFSGGCSTCNLPMTGGAFNIPPTANFPLSNETYHPLNSYQNDPTMLGVSTRTQDVPVSYTLNETGGNNISFKGGKKTKRTKKSKKAKTTKRTRKSKKNKKAKRTRKYKKQKGGIHLGQLAATSYLGPGHYHNYLGSNVNEVPDWDKSIFNAPASLNNTGFNKFNPPLV
jgi:hypothetical protein